MLHPTCFSRHRRHTRKIWYRALSVFVLAQLLLTLASAGWGETRQEDQQKHVLARKIVLSEPSLNHASVKLF